eukprot:gene4963-6938_t
MHIKQVIISGFRSFRSQNEIESFSPKHNVIVGRNGSGKSNFFDAIQFVLLGPKYANLRQEDRQHLLHEGAGSSVMAAYVEIVFDNIDGRLSVESDEVVLRRTVGHKKDEFFLNRKRIQKSEVISLLESAGFSKSNPYYIVQQGKVSNLCVMKDQDRLNLLKEVAGTTVYEERREESLKIMQDTANKQQKVNEVLEFIEERLNELEKEKKELTEYEKYDKQRRAVEYNLYDKEYSKANEQLTQIELVRETERERQQNLYSDLREIQDELAGEEDTLAASKLGYDRLLNKRNGKGSELSALQIRKSTVEVEIIEVENLRKSKTSEINELMIQLKDIKINIESNSKHLIDDIEPIFKQQSELLVEQNQRMLARHNRIETLYGKQGRGSQFSNVKDRNKFLQSQINNLNNIIKTKTVLLEKQTREVDDDMKRYDVETDHVIKAQAENRIKVARYEELIKLIHNRIQHRNDIQEKRKSSWRELEQLQEKIQDAKQELERGKQQLNRALPRHITEGLAMVEQIAQDQDISGYYGPLIDNFTIKADAFKVAVEVASGNALFHMLVDTDDTAAFFMKELDRRKAGRLTFLPLNRLRNLDITYPDSGDVRPLMTIALDYEPAVESAIKQVFGKKLLARDLDTAAHFSKEFRLDAITKEGDLVNAKGGFEGGFHDERISRINAVYKIREATLKLSELQLIENQLKEESESTQTEINDILRELQKLETEKEHLRTNTDQLMRELNLRNQQLVSNKISLDNRKKGLLILSSEISISLQQINDYENEQSLPMVEFLNNEERNELLLLEEEIRENKSIIESLESEVMKIQVIKEKLIADNNDNLLKRKIEIEEKLIILSEGSLLKTFNNNDKMEIMISSQDNYNNININDDIKINDMKIEKEYLLSMITIISNEINEINERMKEKQIEINELEKSVEEKQLYEQEKLNNITEATKMQDKLLNKRTMLADTIQSRLKLIRDLGTLPKKEVDEFKNYSDKTLLKSLKDINEHLKKYSNINRKALDQYISFNEQRETLIERKQEMERDNESIQLLIDNLDSQKDEAILRTFREYGDGLTNEQMMDIDESGGMSEGKASFQKSNVAISTFQGIQVLVSFAGKDGQQYDMQQLSGGQKALVALALIFAIQRCDPAPFYLFDEIDQALDANYRAGVAKLIQRQVESTTAPAQFITTTFRPELVAVADKCYGIALLNKVSNIYPLDKADAQNFVTNLMLEEEAVGKISSVPSFARATRQKQEEDEADEEDGDDDNDDEGGEIPVDVDIVKHKGPRVSKSSRSIHDDDNTGVGEDDDIEFDEEEQEALKNLGLGMGEDEDEED